MKVTADRESSKVGGVKRRLKTFVAGNDAWALLDKVSALRTEAKGSHVPEREIILDLLLRYAANDAFREAPALFRARIARIQRDTAMKDDRREKELADARAEYAAAWQSLLDVCERYGIPVDERHREVKG